MFLPHLLGYFDVSVEEEWLCISFDLTADMQRLLEEQDESGKDEIFLHITEEGRLAPTHGIITSILLMVLP